MITKNVNFQGRAPKAEQRQIGRHGFAWVFALIASFWAGSALAENVLEDITYSAGSGGQVEVMLKFAQPVGEPQIFTTESPPRIALDMADTRNGMNQRRVEIGTGATSGVAAVEAAGRTRVVVDLFRPSSYETRIEGNMLVLKIANGFVDSGDAPSLVVADPTKATASNNLSVSNIDFRRGKNGEGRIIVSFSGPGAGADLKREGENIVLDIFNAKLPSELSQRLDVLDFATPVQFIETRVRGTGVRMEITAAGPFEQLAYQAGSEYVVEIAPVKVDEKKKKDPNAEPEYTGSRVTFNFQDIPTRSVLQLIADVSELNIVVADTVGGNVTLRLINVPWDQALDIIMRAKGLDKRRNGNVIWVAPAAEIAAREQQLEDARIALEERVELVNEYIAISYGKAKDIAELLTQGSMQATGSGAADSGGKSEKGFLSNRGSVSYDERTNTLLLHDTPQKIKDIRDLVALLDRPVQQVLIESRIVIASDDFSRELGVRFGTSGGYEDHHGNVLTTSGTAPATDRMTNVALSNRFSGRSTGLPVAFPDSIPNGLAVPTLGDRLNVNLPVSTPAGSFAFAILGADYLLDLELSAAQTEGRGEIVSSPRVVTANQQEAIIKQGDEIGYVTISAGAGGIPTAQVQFKEAVLELKVTPTITNDNRVFLALNVKKDALSAFINTPQGTVPQIDKREISTSVLVDNGQTVVLGGVYEVEKRNDSTKVPMLGDIPGLGALFRSKLKANQKAELLIFVTPRILSEGLK